MRWLALCLVVACGPAPAAPTLANRTAQPAPEPLAVVGNPGAAVKIAYWFDYTCAHCADFAPTLDRIEATYGDRIGVFYKNFPLGKSPLAKTAAVAAEAARRQGAFIAMHRLLMESQARLMVQQVASTLQQGKEPAVPPPDLRLLATELHLDLARFDRDVADPAAAAAVDRDRAEGERAGIEYVPYLTINGEVFTGDREVAALSRAIDAALASRE